MPSTIIANDMDVETAIRHGDAEALRVLLTEDASRANALVGWRTRELGDEREAYLGIRRLAISAGFSKHPVCLNV